MGPSHIPFSGVVILGVVGLANSYVFEGAQKRNVLSTPLETAIANTTTPFISSTTRTPVPSPPPNPLFDCYTSYMAYNDEQVSADHNRTPSVQPYTTSISTWFTYDSAAEWSTLCDGFPRAKNPPVETKYFYSTITDFNASYTYNMMPPTTLTNPECRFCDQCDDCYSLASFIAYASSVWSDQPEPRTPSSLNWYVPCNTRTPTPTTPVYYPTATDGPECLVIPDDTGTLFYWPVTTADGDFCKYNGTTVTPAPTAPDGSPNTAVINGLTVTSPSAYLVIDSIEARVRSYRRNKSAWAFLGTLTSQTMSFEPTALSLAYPKGNRVKVGWELNTQSINYQDFNTVPYSVYSKAQCSRHYGECDRQYHSYAPYLGSPNEVLTLSSDWKYCSVWGWMRPAAVPITAGVTTTLNIQPAKITDMPIETSD